MIHARTPLLLGFVLLAACVGCGNPTQFASQGFQEVRGAQSQIAVITDVPAVELADHSGIQVNQILSRIGPLAPADFTAQVANNLREKLRALRGRAGTGSPTQLTGEITFYQAGGSIATMLGKNKMAIMHVVVTTGDGRKLGEFLVVATSAALRVTDVDLANALVAGTVQYFQQKLPKG